MLHQDFKEFLTLRNSNGVEYLVVGGYALAAHGHPRYTGDIDIWLGPSAANIARLVAVLEQFGFAGLGIAADDIAKPGSVVQLGVAPVRIDLLSSIDGVTFDECYPRRVMLEFGGVNVAVIGIKDFRHNKLATGRLKDLADVEALGEDR